MAGEKPWDMSISMARMFAVFLYIVIPTIFWSFSWQEKNSGFYTIHKKGERKLFCVREMFFFSPEGSSMKPFLKGSLTRYLFMQHYMHVKNARIANEFF